MKTIYRPSMSEAVVAKCCDCEGNFIDGRRDCKIRSCPLYQYHKYKRQNANLIWVFDKWATHKSKFEESNLSKVSYIKQNLINNQGKINRRACVRAKCFECMNNFHSGSGEGRRDCQINSCPIYYWMPYRKLTPTYDWMFEYSYTKRHRDALTFEGITKEEYIENLMNK